MRGLYAIVDLSVLARRGLPAEDFARAVLAARPCALQVRAKDATARETLAVLRALGPLCRAAAVPLFANDRPDLAVLAGCDGVHLGQRDLPAALARRVGPALRIGVSTHDAAELDAALADRPDYVAFGPVFPTRSKDRPDPVVGLDGLARAVARAGGVPVVAIGGIDATNAPAVARVAPSAALIAGIVPDAAGPATLDAVTRAAGAIARAFAPAGEPVS